MMKTLASHDHDKSTGLGNQSDSVVSQSYCGYDKRCASKYGLKGCSAAIITGKVLQL